MNIDLQKISNPTINSFGVNLFVLRLDQVHKHISGNKYFKLKYNLLAAKEQGKTTLLTFGGAYSNHIAATAAAGKENGFKTIGIIRGDELKGDENATLRFAKECGMHLLFVTRDDYRKIKDNSDFLFERYSELLTIRSKLYILPEGGTNELAIKGCSEIFSSINIPFDIVCCPVGTGGTLTGIISSLQEGQEAIGFSVLSAPGYLEREVKNWLSKSPNFTSRKFQINESYDFGGYAKYNSELLTFIDSFEKDNNIPLDHVYTGKMMYGIYDLIKKERFKSGTTIVAIHTGGLQGKLLLTS